MKTVCNVYECQSITSACISAKTIQFVYTVSTGGKMMEDGDPEAFSLGKRCCMGCITSVIDALYTPSVIWVRGEWLRNVERLLS